MTTKLTHEAVAAPADAKKKIVRAFRDAEGAMSKTAPLLGVSVTVLYKIVADLGMEAELTRIRQKLREAGITARRPMTARERAEHGKRMRAREHTWGAKIAAAHERNREAKK